MSLATLNPISPPAELLTLRPGLLNQVNDAIVTVDLSSSVRYWNRAAEVLFQRDSAEVLGTDYSVSCGMLAPADERSAIYNTILERGEWKGEIECADPAGSRLIIDVSYSPLRDLDGSIQGFVGIHRNVTARREMEDRLRTTESRLKLAQTALGLGTWEIDLRNGAAQSSKELLFLFGISDNQEPLTLEQRARRIHPDDRDVVVREALTVSSRAENTDHQYRIVWDDGSIHWLHGKSTLVCDPNNRPVKLIGVDFDITAVKESERWKSEFATIVQFADLAIFSTDIAGNIATWNSGAVRIFGYSAAEITGKHFQLLLIEDRRKSSDAICERIRRAERTEHLETVCATRKGDRIQILLSAAPILDHSGTALGGAYILWDVSELKLLQRQLGQAQKLESIGQLAAGIAHEINTPIQYIGDNAQFLGQGFQELFRLVEQGAKLAEALRTTGGSELIGGWDTAIQEIDPEYLHREVPLAIEQLLQGVNHVARIVRAMKEFSHPGSVDVTMVDINRAVESTVLVSKNEWKYVADTTIELDPDLPMVPCLAGEVNQVILNLVVNAAHAIGDVVKGSPQKGSIRISTRRKGRFAEIRITDTGTGIPEHIQSKVFDPFFTTKEVGTGTGQGLAIAHAVIVQKHHGSIWFETRQGEGTTFIVQLPLDIDAKSV